MVMGAPVCFTRRVRGWNRGGGWWWELGSEAAVQQTRFQIDVGCQ